MIYGTSTYDKEGFSSPGIPDTRCPPLAYPDGYHGSKPASMTLRSCTANYETFSYLFELRMGTMRWMGKFVDEDEGEEVKS